MTDGKARPASWTAALNEWRAGWPVVLAGVFGFILLSLGSTSMGAFMAPVTASLGFSRSQFSAGLTAYALVGIVMAPLVGVLVDKWGVRAVAITGSLLVGLTFSLFATASGAFVYWLALWLLYACANQLIMTTVWWAAVSRVFTASRGLAISITIFGTGIAAPLAPFVADRLIELQGWRSAFAIMGISSGIGVALVCWITLKAGGRPSPAAQAAPDEATPADPASAGMALSEALRSLTFIKLAIASFLAYAVRLAVAFHLIPMLSAAGVTRGTAVVIGGSYGLWMMLGQTVSGAAMDRFSARWVGALWLVMQSASLALLMLPPHPITLPIVAVALFGTSMGGIAPALPYLTSRYFGLRSFGRLFGIIAGLSGLAFAIGPLLAGYVYDVSRSYAPFLAGAAAALLAAALLIVLMGRYPDHAEPPGSSSAEA
jgi:MFS family permease